MNGKGKIRSLLLFFFLGCFLIAVSYGYAEARTAPRIVEGLIQDVTDTSIEVRGQYYNITGVALIDASGKKVQRNRLIKGAKVEIFFENARITSVLVHEYMTE